MGRPFAYAATRRLAVSASVAHAAIEDLDVWNAWSPFYALDREATTTVSTPSAGVGARYTWDGRASGRGALTILASRPAEQVVMSVSFFAPIATASTARFDVVAAGPGACSVTWTMDGERPWWLAMLAWCTRMDAQMARHFDAGLRALEDHLQAQDDGARRGR